MSQHQSWIPIDDCINSYISESEQSNHKFFKLWQCSFDLMTEMGLDFFYQIRSVKLPVNPNFTVTLPSDCLMYSKVGVLNDVGEIIPLIYNDKLTSYAAFSPDRLQKTQDNTLFNFFLFNTPIWYNFWTGNSFTTLYGMPSGAPFVGSFKIDKTAGVILLGETFSYDYIMLEYVASPQQDQQYYVPIQFKAAFKAGLAWMDIRSIPSSRRGNSGDKRDRKHEFYNQRRLAWGRYRPFNLQEAYEWAQTNCRLTVKI
jgi:hypothetical protein